MALSENGHCQSRSCSNRRAKPPEEILQLASAVTLALRPKAGIQRAFSNQGPQFNCPLSMPTHFIAVVIQEWIRSFDGLELLKTRRPDDTSSCISWNKAR